MAKLKVHAPDGKTLLVDVGSADPSQYDELATSAVDDYMARTGKKVDPTDYSKIDEGIEPVGAGDALRGAGKMTEAGFAGLGDVLTGSETGDMLAGVNTKPVGTSLSTAADNVKRVEDDKLPTTEAANLGKSFGSMVTPGQMAIQAGLGGVGEAVAPAVTGAMKSMAGDYAIGAVSKAKAIAESLGLDNLDAVGQFLLKPLKIGQKEFPAIVKAFSSADGMLSAVEQELQAAGKQLEAISTTTDANISRIASAGGTAMKESTVGLNMAGLIDKVKALKETATGGWPGLTKDAASKFDAMLEGLEIFIKQQANGPTATAFSDLSALETQLGEVASFGSQTESKKAIQQVYAAIRETLNDAANRAGGTVGRDYQEANMIYHRLLAIRDGLKGKAIDARNVFSGGAMGAISATSAALTGALTHSPWAAAVTAAAPFVGRATGNYAPQAIASGLNAFAPAIGNLIGYGPQVAEAIGKGLFSASKGTAPEDK